VNHNNQQYAMPMSPSPVLNNQSPASPIAPEPVAASDVKSVKFDLSPQELSPKRDKSPTHREAGDENRRRGDSDEEQPRRSRHRQREYDRGDKKSSSRRDGSADSASSDGTIELPPRFDEQGRRKDDDPLANTLESVLAGLFR